MQRIDDEEVLADQDPVVLQDAHAGEGHLPADEPRHVGAVALGLADGHADLRSAERPEVALEDARLVRLEVHEAVEVGLAGQRERVAAHAARVVGRIGIRRGAVLEPSFEVEDQHQLVLPMLSQSLRQSSASRAMFVRMYSSRLQMRDVVKPASR